MNNTPDTTSITLESIAQRKQEVRKKLHLQKQIMTDTARDLFAPLAPAADKGNAIMRAFNTGMAVFDGVMLGLRMMKRARRMFSSKKEQNQKKWLRFNETQPSFYQIVAFYTYVSSSFTLLPSSGTIVTSCVDAGSNTVSPARSVISFWLSSVRRHAPSTQLKITNESSSE